MNKQVRLNEKGFTLIEMIMVILLVGILAAVAIPQFLDFRTEGKDAATKSALGALRSAIAMQKGQMLLRCNAAANVWPEIAAISGNDITAGATCTPFAAAISTGERAFTPNALPNNPWSNATDATADNQVVACSGAGCTLGSACNGTTRSNNGWCYNPTTGQIWADSQSSPNTENVF